jgi:transposase
MAGVIKIQITESTQELKRQLNLSENSEVKERLQVLYWLKTKQVQTTSAIANLIGKHRTTVSRWLSKYRQGGLEKLLEVKKSPGRVPIITPSVEEKIIQELQDPQGFASYKEIHQWLQLVQDIEISYSAVHKRVRYGLEGKLKVPRPVHTKQQTGAVEQFKKN